MFQRIGNPPGSTPRKLARCTAGAENCPAKMMPGLSRTRTWMRCAHVEAPSGDSWIVEGIGTYPDGATYHMIQHLRLRDGLVWRATTYFAAPFEAPAWRSAFVVPIG